MNAIQAWPTTATSRVLPVFVTLPGLREMKLSPGVAKATGWDAARDIAVSNLTASARNAAVFMFARLLAIVSSLFSSVT